ncbi:MAG: hypothetical protein O3C19_04575 [Bacteroidetes bacterium]|nr:hypothetical protein [Bacteroidota bacterium]
MKNIKISENTNIYISITALVSIVCFSIVGTLKYSSVVQMNDFRIIEIEHLRYLMKEEDSIYNQRFQKIENYIEKNIHTEFQFQQLKEDLQDLEQDIRTLR